MKKRTAAKTSTKKPLKAPKNERIRLEQLTVHESLARAKGFKKIAGVDEAGRGPMAGPVVAAACMIAEGILFEGITDSKLLTPLKRKGLYHAIKNHPKVLYGIGVVGVDVIDTINIHWASVEAMRLAVNALVQKPDYLFIDGFQLSLGFPSEKVVQGDRLVHCIAAASILAKEIRDEIMAGFHEQYPSYGFKDHKGYCTEGHKKALKQFGPCPIHRRSFAPVKSLLRINE